MAAIFASLAAGQNQDNLGLASGYLKLSTKNFDIQVTRDAQVLASLKPVGSAFDFLPFDLLSRRARNGQYHWGDITIRYRTPNSSTWLDTNSAQSRKPVTALRGSGPLAAAALAPTLPSTLPLNITREWVDVDGDLGLRFTISNTGRAALELGSLGFPAEFNSIFTGRRAEDIQQRCSLADPYVGMHGGYLRVAPVGGTGAALVVTPLDDTPLEAYRNLVETSYSDTAYASQTFEGLYEWQVLTKAWAEKEWAAAQPWNPPSSRILQPQEALTVGLRFTVAKSVRDVDAAVQRTGTPVVVGTPGYILPRDLPGQLLVRPAKGQTVEAITADPPVLQVTRIAPDTYQLSPTDAAWGRVRLTIRYSDARAQTVHYYITKPGPTALADLGRFLTTRQWYTDTADPFGRAPSVMSYDREARAIVTQDSRVWVAGLSDEAGAGSFLAAAAKQAAQPAADEVAKLERFAAEVLWGTVQTKDYAVRKSVFFYQPDAAPGFRYDASADWRSWTSWNRSQAYATDRAYDYVHVAATYWALYRVGRAYPQLLKRQGWEWYLDQAYGTVMRCVASTARPPVQHAGDGLMGETVFGELLVDLKREGLASKAAALEDAMRTRARRWNAMAVPFGSEMAWDSTGQEGVYYWAKYTGPSPSLPPTLLTSASQILRLQGHSRQDRQQRAGVRPHRAALGLERQRAAVLGQHVRLPSPPLPSPRSAAPALTPFSYGGKLRRYERQIHHYGSGLNALVLLAAFRGSPGDTLLLRVGHAGAAAPLANIDADGFAAASFHSWPDTLRWDAYSGDYGPGFVGLVLGSGTYLVEDADAGGLAAYGGVITASAPGRATTVQTRDAVRRRVFVGPLGLLASVDAGVIREFTYRPQDGTVALTLAQLDGVPAAAAATLWLETTWGNTTFAIVSPGLTQARLGWTVPLGAPSVVVTVGPKV